MKSEIFKSLGVILSFTLLFTTCSHSDDDGSQNNNNTNNQIQQIENQVEAGTWRITSFVDSGQDETNDFTGYGFLFNSNGELIATHSSGSSLTGAWSVSDSNSNDDSSSDIDFNIFFNVSDSNNFEDLNDDWDIVSHSDNMIKLRDVSGGNGGIDTLTFEKN
ncbi:hypothetical protein [Hanstruepera marina]|uniref:hypothetical protein n=1 Tax=Hanstruepera marina TaxID=2873265 RepID=UPI0021072455|nr:hypothetical protein [Hanstruepera marina]